MQDFNILLARNIVHQETKFICKECVKLVFEASSFIRSAEHLDNNSDDNSDNVSEDEDKKLVLKSYELGKKLSSRIQSDILKLYKMGATKQNEITKLMNHDPLKWLNNRPLELVHFLCNLCEIDVNATKEKKLNIISKIIELIYYCRNSKLVLPQHFTENLMCYALTNCKTYSNLLGNRSPGGSYPYLQLWLNQQKDKEIVFPSGLVKSIF